MEFRCLCVRIVAKSNCHVNHIADVNGYFNRSRIIYSAIGIVLQLSIPINTSKKLNIPSSIEINSVWVQHKRRFALAIDNGGDDYE